jgi:hypothetical protein
MSDSSQSDNDRPDAGALGGEQADGPPGYGDPADQPGYPGPPSGGDEPPRGPRQEPPEGGAYAPQPPQPPHAAPGPPQDQPQDQPQPGQAAPNSGQYGYPDGPQQGYPQGYQQPGGYDGGYGGYVPVPDHPQATTALTLGLVGMIGTMICGIPAVVGPFAWYMGAKVKREIDASGGQLGGRGQALTGFVLGIVTTVLLVVGILVLGGLIAVGIAGGFEAAG